MGVDANGYCTNCGTYRGPVAQPVSAAPYAAYQVSSPPGYTYPPAPQTRGRNQYVAPLIAGSGLVVLLIVAIVVVTILKSGSGTGALTDPTASPTAPYSPTVSPSPTPIIDNCLVGTWRSSQDVQTLDIPDVGPVKVSGSGLVLHISGDGTLVQDYSQSSTYDGTANGHTLSIKVRGTVNGQIRTANDTISFSGMTANGTEAGYVDGTSVGSAVPLEADSTPVQYTCGGQSASEHGTNVDITFTKTSNSPDA
jgi:hypothetical protein